MNHPNRPDDVTVTIRSESAPASVEGSSTTECAECGATVLVSPATRRSIDEGEYPNYIICVQCATDE
jgi:hypothetical protein